ncbi:MAG: hypothetical protein ACRDOV_06320 [Streptomyces sp.]
MPAPTHGPVGARRRVPNTAVPRIDGDTDADAERDAVRRAAATAAEIVRWGVFSCVLVPVVLLICGCSPGSAFATAGGLAAVTAACRALLRQSERACAQHTYARFTPDRPGPHRGRHSRTGTGTHRGGRYPGQP